MEERQDPVTELIGSELDAQRVIDIFLLLLIGMGPKIALVPYLEITATLPTATKRRVLRAVLVTAAVVAIVLLVLGELLTRLLHFSTGALSVAGGIILLVIAVTMVLERPGNGQESPTTVGDPMRLASYPLAVPYLLNPVGIVALVTLSAEAQSVALFAVVLAIVAVMLFIDWAVFSLGNRVSEHLNPNRMLVTEKVFGFLLAAIAVQLVLDGLHDVGVVHLVDH
jgi:multiple antibiotic resistance protein